MRTATSRRIRVAVDVRGWTPQTRGTDVYVSNLLRRWAVGADVDWALIMNRTGEPPDLPIAAPVDRVSHTATMLSRLPFLPRIVDQVGRKNDAVFLPNLAVYYRKSAIPVVLKVHDMTSLLH